MQSIGRNDTISVPGLCTPTTATIRPSVAAMLYAGAVEETAITTLESSPSAPARLGRRYNVRSSCLRANESGHGGVPPSARTECRGYGSTVLQYHIAVQ